MFKRSVLFTLIILSCCKQSSRITSTQGNYLDPSLPMEARVELLMKEMTLEEKLGQMCQYVGEPAKVNTEGNADEMVNYKLGIEEKAKLIVKGQAGSFLKVPGYREANYLQEQAERSRLKIPLLIGTDAIHGHGMDLPEATIFPTPIGIASSFDTALAAQIARITAKEMRATGFHWTFSPNMDVVRDPRWGRTGECFGEDPLLVSELGAAMVKAYQGKDFSGTNEVLACAKHLVAGGIPNNGLNASPAEVSERTLQEIFYPPFRKAIEAGTFTVMPAHNEVNGIPCHADKKLLTDLLRKQWGFDGFVISDWMDIARLHFHHKVAATVKEADLMAVNAGIDMHMHGGEFLDNVKQLVEEGKIPMQRIDDAVRKILTAKFRLGLFERRYADTTQVKNIVLQPSHREAALEAARRSVVLLKNDNGVLPLNTGVKRIFVTGPNADSQALLGDWSRIQPEENVTTVLEGIRQVVSPATEVDFLNCGEITTISDAAISDAGARASKADVCVVVVGENSIRESAYKTSGENLDRASLELAGRQLELVKAVAATGKPVVVVFINGAPVASPWCAENIPALVEAWEPGMSGGLAVAEIIFGKYNPSGRLPITIPRDAGHIQSYYNYKPSAFMRGKFKFSLSTPLYEFGHGLSYTTFYYSNLQLPKTLERDQNLVVKVEVENTGNRAGEEIVLLFLDDIYSSVTTPVKELKAFRRIKLAPGEKQQVTFTLPFQALSLLNAEMKRVVEQGEFEVIVDKERGKFVVK